MGFGAPSGTFVGMSSLSFKAHATDGVAPNLSINLATDQVLLLVPSATAGPLVLCHRYEQHESQSAMRMLDLQHARSYA